MRILEALDVGPDCAHIEWAPDCFITVAPNPPTHGWLVVFSTSRMNYVGHQVLSALDEIETVREKLWNSNEWQPGAHRV